MLTGVESDLNGFRPRFSKLSTEEHAVKKIASFATPSMAQFAKPEDAVKYRKNALFVRQPNFGRLAGMAAFGEGTDKGDTRAKLEIWKEKAKFNEYSDKMNLEMSKLTVAAKTGSLDSIKAAVAATGGTCKTCHDAYPKD
jgi:cytochrome c556